MANLGLLFSRSTSPAPSKLPVGNWRTKLVAYKKVMDKQQENAAATANNTKMRKPSAYFKLNSQQLKNSHIPMMSRSGSVGSSSSVTGHSGHPPSAIPGVAHAHSHLPPAGSRIASR